MYMRYHRSTTGCHSNISETSHSRPGRAEGEDNGEVELEESGAEGGGVSQATAGLVTFSEERDLTRRACRTHRRDTRPTSPRIR